MMNIISRPVLMVTLLLFPQSVFGQVKKLAETDFTSAKECGRCHEQTPMLSRSRLPNLLACAPLTRSSKL